MTASTYTGNLGGVAGANASCLSDLTANDWMGKAAAVAAGQLVAGKVRALLVNMLGGTPQIGLPLTTYYFARSGAPAVGGANFTTDSLGRGPNNTIAWSAYNYFGIAEYYWTHFTADNYNDNQWAEYAPSCCAQPCSGWTTASPGQTGGVGYSGSYNARRWSWLSSSCDVPSRLVCFVHP
jgi:hypothetical protein